MQHRYEWRYLVGFVHPASGRTVFHLATSVSMPLFEAELAAFAHQPSGPIAKQADRAGLGSRRLAQHPTPARARPPPPALPAAVFPELQPAEHLWPLTNTVLVNRHFATIEELEDAQSSAVSRCKPIEISSAPPPGSHGGPSAFLSGTVHGATKAVVR